MRQVDFDGFSTYHKVVSTDFNAFGDRLLTKFAPNPALDFIKINFARPVSSAPIELTLLDITGRYIIEHTVDQGTDNIEIPVSDLQMGLYVLQIYSGDRKETIRFGKQ